MSRSKRYGNSNFPKRFRIGNDPKCTREEILNYDFICIRRNLIIKIAQVHKFLNNFYSFSVKSRWQVSNISNRLRSYGKYSSRALHNLEKSSTQLISFDLFMKFNSDCAPIAEEEVEKSCLLSLKLTFLRLETSYAGCWMLKLTQQLRVSCYNLINSVNFIPELQSWREVSSPQIM